MAATLIIVLVAAVLVASVLVALTVVLGRRSSAPPPPPPIPEPPPMTGLESALNQVVDRSGRSFADRLSAESAHVDELRVPDDTGPLLRRALDHVAPAPGEGSEMTEPVRPPDADQTDES